MLTGIWNNRPFSSFVPSRLIYTWEAAGEEPYHSANGADKLMNNSSFSKIHYITLCSCLSAALDLSSYVLGILIAASGLERERSRHLLFLSFEAVDAVNACLWMLLLLSAVDWIRTLILFGVWVADMFYGFSCYLCGIVPDHWNLEFLSLLFEECVVWNTSLKYFKICGFSTRYLLNELNELRFGLESRQYWRFFTWLNMPVLILLQQRAIMEDDLMYIKNLIVAIPDM